MDRGNCSTISQDDVTEAIRHYSIYTQLKDTISGINMFECPSCSIGGCRIHVDGNSKLYNWTRRCGLQPDPFFDGRVGGIMIPDRVMDQVEEEIDALPGREQRHGHAVSKTCGAASFQKAGDKPHKFQGMDTSGVIFGVCQHLVVLGAGNTTAGERYARVNAVASLIAEQHNAVAIYGDLMCKWALWFKDIARLQAAAEPNNPDLPRFDVAALERVELLLSAVHAQTHSWPCRVLWSPIFKEGAGTENGEYAELTNAGFSRLGNSIKNCGRSGKNTRLQQYAIEHNTAKILSQAKLLAKKLDDNIKQLRKAEQEWAMEKEDLVRVHRVGLTGAGTAEAHVDEWTSEIKQAAERKMAAAGRGDDPRKEAMELNGAVNQLTFIKQYLKAVESIDQAVAGPGEELQAAVSKKMKELEMQLGRARRQAGNIAEASSSLELRSVCELMVATATQLDTHLAAVVRLGTAAHGAAHLREEAVDDIRALVGEVRDRLTAFKSTAGGDSELVRRTIKELSAYAVLKAQRDIEGLVWCMRKWVADITERATTSKQRTKLRGKLADADASLQQKAEGYNKLVGRMQAQPRPAMIDVGQVKRTFELPWEFDGVEEVRSSIPFKEKLRVCEKYHRIMRCREQTKLVVGSMRNYMVYYTSLKAELEIALQVDGEPMRGMVAMFHRSIDFCDMQLRQGHEKFGSSHPEVFIVDATTAAGRGLLQAARVVELVSGL